MIRAVIQRTAVDIWDNAVAVFALNIASLCVLAIVLYVLTWLVVLPQIAVFMILTLVLAVMLAGFSAMAGLVDQIARRSALSLAPMKPDGVLCLAVAAPAMGLLFAADAFVDVAEMGALSVALTIVGLWAGIVAAQLMVLTPAMALDRSRPVIDRMIWMMAVVLKFPWQLLGVIALGMVTLIMTVGLLPGPAGVAYLFLRTGRIFGQAFDLERPDPLLDDEAKAHLIAVELLPLRNRNARSLLQPWRASE